MKSLKEKIKQIKYSRLKLEEIFVLNHITDTEKYIHKDYPTSIFYKKDNVLLFEWNQKNGYFYCSYTKFWSILQSKYNLNYNEIKSLIKRLVEEHLIKTDITPIWFEEIFYVEVEEHLIKTDINPYHCGITDEHTLEEHLIKKD